MEGELENISLLREEKAAAEQSCHQQGEKRGTFWALQPAVR